MIKKIYFNLFIQSTLVGLILVTLSFPDILFQGKSFSGIQTVPLPHTIAPPPPLIPEATHRMPHHGYTDLGGSVWQSDPMIGFMSHTIRSGDSPYWNPFSATGSLGPETLVDQKFSPLTLIVAIAGGGKTSFHVTYLLLYVIAVGFIFASLKKFFHCSFLSSIVGSVVYLLNGFNIANLSSNVSQVYLYLPICLFFICNFEKNPSLSKFIVLSLAHIPILLTTFFPTTAMGIIGIYTIGWAYLASQYDEAPYRQSYLRIIKVLALEIFSAILAIVFLAPLYLPIWESLQILNSLDNYSQRVFYPANITNLISLFSPKHFFESYNAIDPKLWDPNTKGYIGNVVFHFGIVGMLLVGASLFGKYNNKPLKYVAVTCQFIIFVSLLRVFGVPGIKNIIESIYFLRSIGEQYWWMLIAIVMPFLAAAGTEIIKTHKIKLIGFYLMPLIIILSFFFTGIRYSIPPEKLTYAIFCLTLFLIFFAASFSLILLIVHRKLNPKNEFFALLFIIILLFSEYMYDMNNLRYKRSERFGFKNIPPEVQVLKDNLGYQRYANFGWESLAPEWGSMYGLPQIESLNMNVLPYYGKFFRDAFLNDPLTRWGDFPTLHNAKDDDGYNFEALNFLGVKYFLINRENLRNKLKSLDPTIFPRVYDSPEITIVENKSVFPRAFLAEKLINADGSPFDKGLWSRNFVFTQDQELLNQTKKLNQNLIQTMPDKNLERSSSFIKPTFTNESVQIVSTRNNFIKLKIVTPNDAILVLSDAWHPNWKAYLDSKEIYIGKVNRAFRGIAIPSGEWTLEMTYQPKMLNLSLWLSSAVLGIYFCLFFIVLFFKFKKK